MKKIIIAFDIDGTLRKNSEERHREEIEANDDVVDLLRFHAKCKNTELHLWSNRGEEYCREIREYLHLQKYISESHCHKKMGVKEQQVLVVSGIGTDTYMAQRADVFRPDIAYDDQQAFDGANLVIVVREK